MMAQQGGTPKPGHPLDPRAEGTNKLLKGGATIATSAADVLEALMPQMGRAWPGVEEPVALLPNDDLPDEETSALSTIVDTASLEMAEPASPEATHAAILAALGAAPISIDALARATGMPMRALQGVLLELTLSDRVERHGAQLVSLKAASD